MTSKPNIRWQLLLALVCLGLILSLLSYQVQSVGLCTTRTPATGGSLTEGIVGAPRYLNPLLSDPNPVDREIVNLVFDGLTRYDENGDLVGALAQDWTVNEDGNRITFSLRDDVVWHDGEPFTAEDVAFSYGLLQDEAFPASAALRTLWQSVAISQTGTYSVSFTLPEPYSPFLHATTMGIVPEHILGGVAPGQVAEHPFSVAPVGTGPFMIPSSDNWQRTGRLRLVPNPVHWAQGVSLDNVALQFYPDLPTLIEAFEAGELQALNRVPVPAFAEIAREAEARLYTSTQPRYTQLLFNLSETGSPALQQRDVRRALAYGLDRNELIDRALNGQGVPLEGPFIPGSWAYNPSALTVYAHQPLSATQLLEQSGWTLADGAEIRQSQDQTFSLQFLLLEDPVQRAVAAVIADQWAPLGIEVHLEVVPLEVYEAALTARSFDVALTEVIASNDPDLYDFWSQPAIANGHNYAAWSNRRASEALEQARQIWDFAERRTYYDVFLQLFSAAAPAVTLYQHVYTYAVSEDVHNVDIGRIDQPRDRYASMQDWFLFYRDVAVSCPEPTQDAALQALN